MFLPTRRSAMPENKETADRLAAYSDAVFAVIVTIMVLELKAPEQAAFYNLWPLWPTAISYVVSYLFIAIIWINHHYLVSLLPFATSWIARTRLASSPMMFYAGLFVCIDIAYNIFERQILTRTDVTHVSPHTRRMARRRSIVVLASFAAATVVAF